MPTRIVLKETTPPSRLATPGISPDDERILRATAAGFATPPRTGRRPTMRASSSQRKVVGFRSSILRDLSNNQQNSIRDDLSSDDDVPDEAAQQRRLELHLSNEDIRASPRLLGYLFGGIGEFVKYFWLFLTRIPSNIMLFPTFA